MLLIVILLVANGVDFIGGYCWLFYNGYWCKFYWCQLLVILLVAIGADFIGVNYWLFY